MLATETLPFLQRGGSWFLANVLWLDISVEYRKGFGALHISQGKFDALLVWESGSLISLENIIAGFLLNPVLDHSDKGSFLF